MKCLIAFVVKDLSTVLISIEFVIKDLSKVLIKDVSYEVIKHGIF